MITGPFLLHIGGIPTPLGFIFGFFPDTRNATSGILFPKYGDERRRGLFLRDGGWYQVWNDQIHTAVTGDIYSKGSWGLKMRTVYKKRYAYGGHLNITFNRNKTPETDETPMDEKDFWLNWFHRPESLGRNSRFSASVQFGTSTFNQYNLSTVNFSNNVRSSFQSKVDFSGVIPRSPFSYSISARHNQNIQTKVLDVSLPEFSLNMNRVYPAKRSKLDILKRLNVGWGFNTSNRVTNVVRPGSAGFTLANRTVATDTIPVTFGAFNKLMKNATNGAKHRIDMSTSFALLEYLNFTPSFNIEELWYLQELDYEYLPEKNAVRIDTLNGFSRSMTYSTGIGLSTQLYGIFNFIRSRKIQAIRHITTPSVSFSYRPDFSKPRFGYYKNVQVDTTNTGKPIFRQLSIYDGFRFGKPSLGESASMTFSVSNKFEMKVRNDTTTRKVSLLDNLSLNGSYNFLADSFKLSDINIAARTSLFDRKVQVNMGATLDPYSYLPTSLENKKLRRTNAYALRTGQGVGRFTSMRFSLSTNFNSQANNAERSNGRRQTPVNDIDQFGGEASNQFGSLNDGGGTNRAVPEYFYDPNAYVDINIPWNVRLSYDYSYRWTPTNTTTRQSIKAYGQLKLTPKWDITFNSGYDFDRKEFTQTSVGVYRDLGCWDMRANWIPFGAFTSYSIDIQIKSSILKDLKISRRRSQFERRF